MHKRLRGPKGSCSTCGFTYFVSELKYIARFGAWQCPPCDDSNTPPEVPNIPTHPFEGVRRTAAPLAPQYEP